jgi:transglutaminase-like putative cysteine protease
MRQNYHYRDEDQEVVRSPEFMLNDYDTLGYCEGDCDDIATLCASFSKAVGNPTRLTAVQTGGPGEFDHVFCEYQLGGNWIPVDPTVQHGTVYSIFGLTSEGV